MPSRFLIYFAAGFVIAAVPFALAEDVSNEPKPEVPVTAPPADTATQGALQPPAENAVTTAPEQGAGPVTEQGAAPVPEQSVAPVPATPPTASEKETPPKSSTPPVGKQVGQVIESGMASVYSSDLEGRPTASGAPYDSQKLTAAHRTLPLGSQIRVTDAASGRSVSVTVNDRWGGGPGQVVNLSRRAADEIGMRGSGQRKVDLSVEKMGEGQRAPPAARGYTAATPQLLPARIEATSNDSAGRARGCQNEANILGLQDTLREIHVRNCLKRKPKDSAASNQGNAKQ